MVQAPLAFVAAGVTLAASGTWWSFSKVRYFDPDEFEHLHFSWCVTRGMVPYRDFFEHHTPWFHYALAGLMPLYQVDRRFADTIAFIGLARRIDLMLAVAAIALTFALARRWRGSQTGWIAIALLATTPVFARKTFEIRPDVLALVLWLGCLVALARALSGVAPDSRRREALFALSGALLGGAIMSTQKLLMVMPAFALAMAWYLAGGEGDRRDRVRAIGMQAAGFAVPVLVTLGYFWSRGALGAFFHFNLALNVHWKTHHSPLVLLKKGFAEDPIVLVFGGLGMLLEGSREFRSWTFSAGKLLLLSAVGLIAGLWEMPIAQEQYYLSFLPLLAIFGGGLMAAVVAAGGEYRGWNRRGLRYVLGAAFLGGTIALLMLWAGAAPQWLEVSVGLLLAAGTVLMIRSKSEAALAVLLCGVCLWPYYLARVEFLRNNAFFLHPLRFVIEQTRPSDTMMDGWTGIGVFRPHAYFYWFLHAEILAMMSGEQRDELLTGLQSGTIAPRYILLDDDLMSVSARILWFVSSNYQPVAGEPMIWERKSQVP